MNSTAYQAVPRCPECGAYMQHGSGKWQCWDWECMLKRLENIQLPPGLTPYAIDWTGLEGYWIAEVPQ